MALAETLRKVERSGELPQITRIVGSVVFGQEGNKQEALIGFSPDGGLIASSEEGSVESHELRSFRIANAAQGETTRIELDPSIRRVIPVSIDLNNSDMLRIPDMSTARGTRYDISLPLITPIRIGRTEYYQESKIRNFPLPQLLYLFSAVSSPKPILEFMDTRVLPERAVRRRSSRLCLCMKDPEQTDTAILMFFVNRHEGTFQRQEEEIDSWGMAHLFFNRILANLNPIYEKDTKGILARIRRQPEYKKARRELIRDLMELQAIATIEHYRQYRQTHRDLVDDAVYASIQAGLMDLPNKAGSREAVLNLFRPPEESSSSAPLSRTELPESEKRRTEFDEVFNKLDSLLGSEPAVMGSDIWVKYYTQVYQIAEEADEPNIVRAAIARLEYYAKYIKAESKLTLKERRSQHSYARSDQLRTAQLTFHQKYLEDEMQAAANALWLRLIGFAKYYASRRDAVRTLEIIDDFEANLDRDDPLMLPREFFLALGEIGRSTKLKDEILVRLERYQYQDRYAFRYIEVYEEGLKWRKQIRTLISENIRDIEEKKLD